MMNALRLPIPIVIALVSACSSHSADSRQSGSADPSTKGVTAIAIPPGVLPGWTLRSEKEGWWNAAGDQQLFVSRVTTGAAFERKPASERAAIVAGVYGEALRREGGTMRPVPPDELPKRPGHIVACVAAVAGRERANSLSCAFAREGTGPVLGIEYTLYGDADDKLVARAAELVGKVASAVVE